MRTHCVQSTFAHRRALKGGLGTIESRRIPDVRNELRLACSVHLFKVKTISFGMIIVFWDVVA